MKYEMSKLQYAKGEWGMLLIAVLTILAAFI